MSNIFTPGPTPNTVRSADGPVQTAPDGWVLLPPGDAALHDTDDGIRAVKGAQVIDPESVRRYLEGKFGDDLKRVWSAMTKLAKAFKPKELAERAFGLYEQFRPSIPESVKGWGAKGDLDLGLIEALAKDK